MHLNHAPFFLNSDLNRVPIPRSTRGIMKDSRKPDIVFVGRFLLHPGQINRRYSRNDELWQIDFRQSG
jgi:hypothetical protein